MSNVADYLKKRIHELNENRVTLMTSGLLTRNAWFKHTIDQAMVGTMLPNIEEHIQSYEEILFKIKSLDWEIEKTLGELKSHISGIEFETFKWTTMPSHLRTYVLALMTTSQLDEPVQK